jgi:membrane associated rhomboid family serine protease
MSMALPQFAGATRRLILLHLAIFFGFALLGLANKGVNETVSAHLLLEPAAVLHGQVWQLVTYPFLPMGILGTAFAMLTLWFTGSYLEEHFGPRWLLEFYLGTAAGGGLLASLLTLIHLAGLRPDLVTLGAWPPLMALLVAFGVLAGDMPIRLFFVLEMKAKYLVWAYILYSLAVMLRGNDRFGALTELTAALCGYLWLKFVPRRGVAFAVSEQWFTKRNDYTRWKRRRASKKFVVYMKRKDGRDVHFDAEGRYISPEDAERKPRDENDRSWMN